jgi:hypothetical protein
MRVKRQTKAVANEPLSVLGVQRLFALAAILAGLFGGWLVGWMYGLAIFLGRVSARRRTAKEGPGYLEPDPVYLAFSDGSRV